jgi:hypothetical protein
MCNVGVISALIAHCIPSIQRRISSGKSGESLSISISFAPASRDRTLTDSGLGDGSTSATGIGDGSATVSGSLKELDENSDVEMEVMKSSEFDRDTGLTPRVDNDVDAESDLSGATSGSKVRSRKEVGE